jgi:hypothetical protein
MCHHVNSYFVVPTCTLSVHDHGRRPAILHPSEDRIHGPGCPCNSGTNPTRRCGTTFRTGAHTHGAYSRIPPRLHLLNLSSSTRSSMQHSRLLHLLRSSNRRHSSTPTSNAFPLYRSTPSTVTCHIYNMSNGRPLGPRYQISPRSGNKCSLVFVLTSNIRIFSSPVHSPTLAPYHSPPHPRVYTPSPIPNHTLFSNPRRVHSSRALRAKLAIRYAFPSLPFQSVPLPSRPR